MSPALCLALIGATGGTPANERAIGAVALWTIIASLLLIFVVIVASVNIARRRQRRREIRKARAAKDAQPPPDPWVEAGRRVQSDSPRRT
ncbi:MAG: hypothetical protein JSV91_00280 [Phycisphaerales bacterium]|nr:MAG: hypothetical protein JSV91_00280 [Phycisphaerales bacterium]